MVDLPPFPTIEGLEARLQSTRDWAHRLLGLKRSKAAMALTHRALDDLADAERLLRQPGVAHQPHTLRAADVCLDVAQWRLVSEESHQADAGNEYPHRFAVYDRIPPSSPIPPSSGGA